MVEPIQLVIDCQQFERTNSGGVFGPIHLQMDEYSFPRKEWTDFVLAFVRAWIEALIDIGMNSTDRAQVWFMDGPFTVDISRGDQAFVEILLLQSSREGNVVLKSIEAGLFPLLQNAKDISEAVLLECSRRGWSSNDIGPLVKASRIAAQLLDGAE
jgi:hypothetical protein